MSKIFCQIPRDSDAHTQIAPPTLFLSPHHETCQALECYGTHGNTPTQHTIPPLRENRISLVWIWLEALSKVYRSQPLGATQGLILTLKQSLGHLQLTGCKHIHPKNWSGWELCLSRVTAQSPTHGKPRACAVTWGLQTPRCNIAHQTQSPWLNLHIKHACKPCDVELRILGGQGGALRRLHWSRLAKVKVSSGFVFPKASHIVLKMAALNTATFSLGPHMCVPLCSHPRVSPHVSNSSHTGSRQRRTGPVLQNWIYFLKANPVTVRDTGTLAHGSFIFDGG